MSRFHEILNQYWGYSEFRPLQEEIIESVSNKKDTLGLMPTGGGKSITFQVPALAMDGLCLVVTPLIALMKDQVDNLRAKGIRALAVYSGMSYQEILTTYENAIFGNFKFLYISPERLNTSLFLQKLQYMQVCMLVVDEAHCISQWGYDFRPSYLKIAKVREYIGENVPILALTATATHDVIDDIQNKLQFKQKNVFTKSFERKNLIYALRHTQAKENELIDVISKMRGSTLVYVRSRSKTKEISDKLNGHNLSSDFFHAGLSSSEKTKKQEAWKRNEVRIIVCTNAFGMGIDKPDVRLVIHLDLPNSIEEYFQEAGRAGRDEKKAFALIMFNKKDLTQLTKRIGDEFPEKKFIQKVYDSLAYFYQVAEGFGEGGYRNFNIFKFAKTYKVPVIPTHHALKILTLAGYIDYQDEVNNKARVLIKATRQELYQYDITSQHSEVLNCLLRLYTGFFSEFVAIEEDNIANSLNISTEMVYETLIYLSKINIIDYIPARKEPIVGYVIPRQQSRHLILNKDVYETRLKKFTERVKFMSDYVQQTVLCRNQFLLAYFGEKNTTKCNACDICKKNDAKTLNAKTAYKIEEALLILLEQYNDGLSLKEIHGHLSTYNEADIIFILRQSIDQKRIVCIGDLKFKFVR